MIALLDRGAVSRRARLLLSLGALWTGCGGAPPPRPATLTFAASPTPDLTEHAAAAVRLRVEDGRVSMLRSGVMIDARGYVLTTFSSIGVESFAGGGATSRGGGARPGTLYDGDHVAVEVFDGPYASVPTEYVARVVRGDIRLNLALLRITATLDGLLPEDHRFSAIDLSTASSEPLWGGTGFAIGASANVPSLTVYQGSLIAGISNSQGAIAGYLVDLQRTTLDGAPYYDADGHFVGVLSRGFLRPPSRIPQAWLDAIGAGPIEDREVVGIERLVPGVWSEIDLIGDSTYIPVVDEERSDATEEFVFSLPSLQAGSIIVEPAVSISAYQGGRMIESGTGEIFIPSEADVLIAVRMPRPDDPRGLRLRVRFEPLR
jgi:hypothetical protein